MNLAAQLLAIALLAAGGPPPEAPHSGVTFEVRHDGEPVAEPKVEIAIRERREGNVRVVQEGVNAVAFDLPPGTYDSLVRYTAVAMRPLRYHTFEVAEGRRTLVTSDIETFALTVFLEGASDDVQRSFSIEDTASGERASGQVRAPLKLPASQYRISLTGGGPERATTLYLNSDTVVALSP